MTPNLTATAPAPHLLMPDLTADLAKALDVEIRTGVETYGKGSFDFNVATGRTLAKFHAGRGYKALGYQNWKSYLAAMPDLGLTQLNKMMRIGEAVELGLLQVDTFKADGMNGTTLLLYGQLTDRLDKLQPLIEATWSQVKGKSVRDVEQFLQSYVDQHWDDYHSHPKRPNQGSGKTDHAQKWETEFRTMDADGQAAFIKQMWDFLEHHDPGNHPQPSTN